MKTQTQVREKAVSQSVELAGPALFGMWSGGNFLRFGVPVGPERLKALIRRAYEKWIRTFMTADVYGNGEADTILGEVLAGYPRDSTILMGGIGHDFYKGERNGEKGYPRFTHPKLRGDKEYASYLEMAARESLKRLKAEVFDVLFLHNPDQTGYTSKAVWDGMARLKKLGLTRELGIAPGPANGFTLDLIGAFEDFHEIIDWAMIILNPYEPWPGELCLPAAEKFGIKIITRVVDYGGFFHGTVRPGHIFPPGDHRSFRPPGWVEEAEKKWQAIRPIADKYRLTPLQLACQWNLNHPAVVGVVPTLIQESDPAAKSIEVQLEELSQITEPRHLDFQEVQKIAEVGNNKGCMPLKGGSSQFQGTPQADQWWLTGKLVEVAQRWGIAPDRDLYCENDPRDLREKGAPKKGAVQALNQRLYFQLQVFGNCKNPIPVVEALKNKNFQSVVYSDLNDPWGIGVLLISEGPDFFVREARSLLAEEPFASLTQKPEFTMMGRTYATGREQDLEHWLLKRPRLRALNPQWPWAVWYPLRRTGAFEKLSREEQGKILSEHALIGRDYGDADYAHDIRLACHGLDKNDNEFVIGLVGRELYPLSSLVQAMRKTRQTSEYLQSLGPFFIGKALWQSPQ